MAVLVLKSLCWWKVSWWLSNFRGKGDRQVWLALPKQVKSFTSYAVQPLHMLNSQTHTFWLEENIECPVNFHSSLLDNARHSCPEGIWKARVGRKVNCLLDRHSISFKQLQPSLMSHISSVVLSSKSLCKLHFLCLRSGSSCERCSCLAIHWNLEWNCTRYHKSIVSHSSNPCSYLPMMKSAEIRSHLKHCWPQGVFIWMWNDALRATLVAYHDTEWVKGLRKPQLIRRGLYLECLFLKFLLAFGGRSRMTETGRNVAGWNGPMTDASFIISLTLTLFLAWNSTVTVAGSMPEVASLWDDTVA